MFDQVNSRLTQNLKEQRRSRKLFHETSLAHAEDIDEPDSIEEIFNREDGNYAF